MTGRLRDLVFRGILARHAVEELQTAGLLRTPLTTTLEREEHDLFAPVPEAIRNASQQMQRCYRVLFAFENSVRDLIATRFQEEDGEEWFAKRATSEMMRKAQQRKEQEEKNHWHPGRHEHPLYRIDFADLGLLIMNHWDLFKDFFPNQAWMTSRFHEAERSRHVIAHTNLLAADEVRRLEMYFRDWLNQTN